jgi:large subunit ribosomal protein L10
MRPEKKAFVDEFTDTIKVSSFLVLTDYQGLSVHQLTVLRKELGSHGAQFHILRNRLFKHAAEAAGLDTLSSTIDGPTAMVNGEGDFPDIVKILKKFEKENNKPSPKAALWDNQIISENELAELANLPEKPVMQSKFLGVLNAPMGNLAGVLNQKLASLLYCLNAVKEKKQANE